MAKPEKSLYDVVMEVEGAHEVDSEETLYKDLQVMINKGMWSMQGSFGSAMMDAIRSGSCCLGRESARDAYGNFIPSRYDVQPGTKGSIEFVKTHRGEEWADMIEQVE